MKHSFIAPFDAFGIRHLTRREPVSRLGSHPANEKKSWPQFRIYLDHPALRTSVVNDLSTFPRRANQGYPHELAVGLPPYLT